MGSGANLYSPGACTIHNEYFPITTIPHLEATMPETEKKKAELKITGILLCAMTPAGSSGTVFPMKKLLQEPEMQSCRIQ